MIPLSFALIMKLAFTARRYLCQSEFSAQSENHE